MTQTSEIVCSPQTLTKDLKRYRFFSWLTGIMLLILTANMGYKYLYIPLFSPDTNAPGWTMCIPVIHGWCYVLYLIFCSILAIHMRWPLPKMLITLLAGTIPFLSFVAEHYRTQEVRAVISTLPAEST